MIHTNLIHSAYQNGIKNIIFLGSSCMYPKYCKQPMKETDLSMENLSQQTSLMH